MPPGSVWRFGNPCFTYGVVVGIFFIQFFHPIAHGIIVGVRISIHTDPVYVGIFDPPETVLDEVAVNMRIFLIEIGHGSYEPAIVHLAKIILRCVRIYMRSQLEGSLYEVLLMVGVVEPVFARHILYPHMFYATMVENHIHYDFDAARMRLFYELLIFFIGSETGVYFIIIGSGIAMIRTSRHVVFQYRSKP